MNDYEMKLLIERMNIIVNRYIYLEKTGRICWFKLKKGMLPDSTIRYITKTIGNFCNDVYANEFQIGGCYFVKVPNTLYMMHNASKLLHIWCDKDLQFIRPDQATTILSDNYS